MATVTPQLFAYRCRGCWQSVLADTSECGQEKACEYCAKANTVPEATQDAIEAAKNVAPSGQAVPSMVTDTASLSRAELKKLAAERAKKATIESQNSRRCPVGVSASRSSRLLARIVDAVVYVAAFIVSCVTVLLLEIAGVFEHNLDANGVVQANPVGIVILVFPLILILIFNTVRTVTQGQTIGKMVMGIKIVTADGLAPGVFQGIILRSWLPKSLGFIPGFGLFDITLITLEARRCAHDYIAQTYVIKA